MTDDQKPEGSGPQPNPDPPEESPDFPLPGAERAGDEEPTAEPGATPDSEDREYIAGGESTPGGEGAGGTERAADGTERAADGEGTAGEVELDMGRWILEGWKLIRDDLVGYIIAALILITISAVAYKIHPLVWLAVAGPMKAGFFLMTANHMRTGRPLIGDLFQAFNKYLAATLAMLLMTVFAGAAYLFCFIPGLFVRGFYFFTFMFIVDRGLDFWDAMEASRKVASRDYLEFALFALVLFVLNCVGLLCLGIGLLITIPLSFAAVTCAYRELVGLAEDHRPANP